MRLSSDSRRSFLKQAAVGTAAVAAGPAIWTRPGFARVAKPSDELRFATIGIREMS